MKGKKGHPVKHAFWLTQGANSEEMTPGIQTKKIIGMILAYTREEAIAKAGALLRKREEWR